ncbi:hypothetical protein [Enterococcus rivorum]|uniref:hypothetical protein n=1 Tax=Enterococcus rivorum TaxID=762845 RepID=UPI00363C09AD
MKYINIGLLLAMLIGIFQPVITFADEWNSDMPESSTDVPVLIDGKINDELSENDQMTATLSTSIASGTFGTSDWYIDLDGVLHIEEGEFADTPKVNGYSQSPWLNYSATLIKSYLKDLLKHQVV